MTDEAFHYCRTRSNLVSLCKDLDNSVVSANKGIQNNELTKNYFDALLKNFFCSAYQLHLFEATFQPIFDGEDPLGPGMTIEYKMNRAVHAELYDLFNKFRKKYDCDYHTKNDIILFTPEFSEVRNTHWIKKAG